MALALKESGGKNPFTLIELLVAVAIIAILAALLLPGLSKARDMAKRSSCLANEKQQAIGYLNYADDWKGWMPVACLPNSGSQYQWKLDVGTYLGINTSVTANLGKKAFRCPSWQEPAVSIGAEYRGGYGWSIGKPSDKELGFGYNDAGLFGYMTRVKLSSASGPSSTVVCGEAIDWVIDGTWDYAYVYNASYSSLASVGMRHGKGINMAWADGHAEWKTQAALRQGQNGDVDWFYRRRK